MAKNSKYASTAKTETKADEKPEVSAATVSTVVPVTAQKGHVSALAFVANGGDALSSTLLHAAMAKEAEQTGPIEMFCFLEFGLTEAVRAVIPEVGSKMGETGNKPYDRYSSKIKTDKGERTVPGSWFTDVIRNTSAGINIAQRIDWCNGNTEDMPREIADMGTGARAQEKKRLANRLSYMRTALTRGAMLWHHVEYMGQINPARVEVKMPFAVDQSDKGYRIFNNVIRLIDPAKELEDKVFTVSEFLALDPAKIPAGTEVTLASLEATKARKPRVKGAKVAGGKADYAVPATLEQFLSLLNIGSTAIDQSTDGGKMLTTKILAVCAAQGQASDDAVETLGDFLVSFEDTIWTVINAKYNKIKADKAAAQNIKAGRAVAAA